MTTLERTLILSMAGLYGGGILIALLVTGQVAAYLPHAGIFVLCAVALRAMVYDRRP